MTTDLSTLFAPDGRIPVECPHKIRWNDYQVCTHLGPYVMEAVTVIERGDQLVRKVVVTPESVLAYFPELSESDMAPVACSHVEVRLPPGLYGRLLDLSNGPLSPFPVEGPSEEDQLFLGRVHRLAFPETRGGPRHVVMNPYDFATLRKWWSKGKFDVCIEATLLRQGFQGTLWEIEGCLGSSVSVWVARTVPRGSIGLSASVPQPKWDGYKAMRLESLLS